MANNNRYAIAAALIVLAFVLSKKAGEWNTLPGYQIGTGAQA